MLLSPLDYIQTLAQCGQLIGTLHISISDTKTANKCFSVAGVPSLEFEECDTSQMILIKESFQVCLMNDHCEFASEKNKCHYLITAILSTH